ncbi:MAG: NAD(P)H-hydrate dehydratase [Myxococcales bacterium]|nr:NAD(P)H-hydrate dehydratase [Myxococcales bacterium]
MQPVLSRAQVRSLDRHTIETIGIPALVLMESAGRSVADVAIEALQSVKAEDPAVLCVVGPGNNGADAVVAARYLHERAVPITLAVLADQSDLTAELEDQLRWVWALGLETLVFHGESAPARIAELMDDHQVIIDGLFGTGLSRSLTEWRKSVVEVLASQQRRGCRVVAVDIPTGVDANTGQTLGAVLPADWTVSFQYPKLGQLLEPGRVACGELRVVDIGIPGSQLAVVAPEVVTTLGEECLRRAWPIRAPDTHKGSYGHVLVIAGVPERPGAAYLAARAALRAGVGSVTVGSCDRTITRLSPMLVELMGRSLGQERVELEALQEALTECTAVVIGPSLAPDEKTADVVRASLANRSIPVVLDAGALRAMGSDVGWLAERPGAATVLTPHPGEAADLLGWEDTQAVQMDRVAASRELAHRSGSVVVLKGATTVVSAPGGASSLCVRGNPGMATAGTGDVLAGIIGALLARGLGATLAAQAGVELHARAGDRGAALVGMESLQASDLIASMGQILSGIGKPQ